MAVVLFHHLRFSEQLEQLCTAQGNMTGIHSVIDDYQAKARAHSAVTKYSAKLFVRLVLGGLYRWLECKFASVMVVHHMRL